MYLYIIMCIHIYIYMNIYTFPNLSGVWFKGPSLFRVPRSFSAFRPFSCASSPANWSKTYGGTALGIWMGFQKKTAEIPWKSREHPETMNLGVHWLMVCFCFVEFSVNLKRAKKLYIYIKYHSWGSKNLRWGRSNMNISYYVPPSYKMVYKPH